MAGEMNLAQMQPDPVLSNIAIQSAVGGGFVADRLLPVRTVGALYGRYAIWGRENIIADANVKRAFGAPPNQINVSRTFDTFGITFERALEDPITDEERGSDVTGTIDEQRTQTLTHRVLMDLEMDVVSMVKAIGNTTAVAVAWNAAANVVIEKNIDDAKELFVLQFGLEPNTILLPVPVARVVKRDATVRDQIKYTHQDILINGDLPPVFYNMNVIIPGAISKSAPAQPVVRLWDMKEAVLLYIDPQAPNENTNTWALQIRCPIAGGLTMGAYKWRDPNPMSKTDHVGVGLQQTEKVVNSGLALRITGVLP